MATEVLHANNGVARDPKITLYTNHFCPYAQRAHIALQELHLPFEEVIIDLDRPRDPWFLKINPRGLVPTIKYSNESLNEEIVTESQIVAQFLADSRPSNLLPSSHASLTAPLVRARVNYFIDTWNSKIQSFFFTIIQLRTTAEMEAKTKTFTEIIQKEIEPLLADAAPFFGNSKDLTLVEVHCAPFLLRFYAMCNGELLPKSLRSMLQGLTTFDNWAKATIAHPSVTQIWDESATLEKISERVMKMRAQAK